MKESELLIQRLEQLRREIGADSNALRSRWRASPLSSRRLLGALAGAGGLLFSARRVSLLRKAGLKPLILVALLKIVLSAIAKRRR
jgi:hypothetical protein